MDEVAVIVSKRIRIGIEVVHLRPRGKAANDIEPVFKQGDLDHTIETIAEEYLEPVR